MRRAAIDCGCALAAVVVLALAGCADRSSPPAAATPADQAVPPAESANTGDDGSASADPAPEPATTAAVAPDVGEQAGDGTEEQAAGRNTDADVDLALDTLHNDHKPFRDVFDRLKQGVAAGDKAAVAALVVYPLEVTIDGRKRKIGNAAQFVDSWDRIVTPDIAQAIARQEYRDAFVNWQGLMVGDGQVWIGDVCRDKDCKKVDVGVSTFQEVLQ